MPYAPLELKDSRLPFHSRWGDFYFSKQGPLEESDQVFLAGNAILQRWQGRKIFTIGELGFGVGLNFLNTLNHWRQSPRAPERLFYFAWEREPVAPETMEFILGSFPPLRAGMTELLPQLPPPLPGIYNLVLARGAVQLILVYGDVRKTLPQTVLQADAWYLDGFSPRLNPEMWEASLMNRLAERTGEAGTFATYSAASQVRKNLTAAGFRVETLPGFGGKRHMLKGTLPGPASMLQSPWGAGPLNDEGKEAIILGAGLAGCSLAHSLGRREWDLRLYDRRPEPAAEASGNRCGILYPYISLNHETQSQFFWAGYQYTRGLWESLKSQGEKIGGAQTGLLILEQKSGDADRWHRFCERYGLPPSWLKPVDRAEASAVAQFPLASGGLFLPSGSWIAPKEFCRALIRHRAIRFQGNTKVTQIRRHGEVWQLLGEDDKIIDQSSRLFISNALGLKELLPNLPWNLKAVKGQTTRWRPHPATPAPRALISGEAYLVAHPDGTWELGATFEREFEDLQVNRKGHQSNWARMKSWWLEGPENLPADRLQGRAALRACSRNRWPLVGPIHSLPGLYVSSGHGSKGLLTTPLSGECLARHLNNEPVPLLIPMMKKLLPPQKEAESIQGKGDDGTVSGGKYGSQT